MSQPKLWNISLREASVAWRRKTTDEKILYMFYGLSTAQICNHVAQGCIMVRMKSQEIIKELTFFLNVLYCIIFPTCRDFFMTSGLFLAGNQIRTMNFYNNIKYPSYCAPMCLDSIGPSSLKSIPIMKIINTQNIAMTIALSFLAGISILGLEAQETSYEPPSIVARAAVAQSTALLPVASPETPSRIATTMNVIVTAYSSDPAQTDDTPFITASGNRVRDGIVATNLLPLGTKIKIPDVYGDRVFTVDDRMHPRKTVHVDIWFPSYWQAKNFGVKRTHIEVLEG
jgi:3D (Asp-Asp-Asp) domain-containing protein